MTGFFCRNWRVVLTLPCDGIWQSKMEGYHNPSLIVRDLSFSEQITRVLRAYEEHVWVSWLKQGNCLISHFSEPDSLFIEILQLLGFFHSKQDARQEIFANIWSYVSWKSARAQNTRVQELSFNLKNYCFFTLYKSFKPPIKYLQASRCLKKSFCKFVEFTAENFFFFASFYD